MRRASAGIMAASMVLLAGCAGQVSGQAERVATDPSGSVAVPTPAGGLDMGPSFDPCTAITSEQATRLGVGDPRHNTSSSGTRACIWSHFLSEPEELYLVAGRNDHGLEYINPVGAPFTVGRFPAVVGRNVDPAEFDRACSIFIGVRTGQGLQVAYRYEGTTMRMTHDLACAKARPVAELVIANLDKGGN
ncbi:MAG: DUF3558 domain-containing protein [Pseudonocardia sp.]|nr:DUF3558 domain-containing protein [Pseudonocardia sp.]